MKIDGATADQIETWFIEGDRAADRATEERKTATCPYTDKLAQHWWTRGYSYRARLMRAIEAERGQKL